MFAFGCPLATVSAGRPPVPLRLVPLSRTGAAVDLGRPPVMLGVSPLSRTGAPVGERDAAVVGCMTSFVGTGIPVDEGGQPVRLGPSTLADTGIPVTGSAAPVGGCLTSGRVGPVDDLLPRLYSRLRQPGHAVSRVGAIVPCGSGNVAQQRLVVTPVPHSVALAGSSVALVGVRVARPCEPVPLVARLVSPETRPVPGIAGGVPGVARLIPVLRSDITPGTGLVTEAACLVPTPGDLVAGSRLAVTENSGCVPVIAGRDLCRAASSTVGRVLGRHGMPPASGSGWGYLYHGPAEAGHGVGAQPGASRTERRPWVDRCRRHRCAVTGIRRRRAETGPAGAVGTPCSRCGLAASSGS